MLRFIISSIALLTINATAWDLDTPVDSRSFMRTIKGNYTVLAVNGIKPHTNSPAQVAVDDPESAEWTMPYCLSDACLPGFISFAYANTEVFDESTPQETKFLIVLKENGKAKSFVWRESQNKIYFRNPNYELPGGKITDLEHELKRIP